MPLCMPLFVGLSGVFRLSVFLSVCQSICQSVVCLSVDLSLCLCVCLSVCLSISTLSVIDSRGVCAAGTSEAALDTTRFECIAVTANAHTSGITALHPVRLDTGKYLVFSVREWRYCVWSALTSGRDHTMRG
jgi:hypothetical protein